MTTPAYLFLIIAMWAWCVIFFWLIQKPVFGLANRKSNPGKISITDLRDIYRKGSVSDFIIASYLIAIPILTGLAHSIFPAFDLRWVLVPYTVLTGISVSLICIGDTALYSFWQSKIDASVFAYLRHPKGAFASVSNTYLAIAVACALIVATIFCTGWIVIINVAQSLTPSSSPTAYGIIINSILAILMVGIAFMIIRGLKIRPNNPSVVYFSPVQFYNHWALNPIYNMIYSLGTKNEFKGKFRSFGEEECGEIFNPLFPTSGSPQIELLNTKRPNILTIVWESFGGRFCEAIGKDSETTPCFNKLCKEGVFFSNCRASSFRTDRALPAIFCGLPGQPTTSIVRYTRKLANLPAFPADLRKLGYDTTAVHGGELTIMHKSDFYLSSGHSRLIAQKDMPKNLEECKWGVHDGPVMDLVFDDIMRRSKQKEPWLISVQTLSSHEPFTVPYARLEDKEKNSMAYTDAAIGSLINRLKETDAWKDLLVIIVADHGLNNGDTSISKDLYSHIPLLWTGGAVKAPVEIDTIMSQTDIAATLLGQLRLPHDAYPFSRDILSDTYSIPSSFHSDTNGFLFTDTSGITEFDLLTYKSMGKTADSSREDRGKAILQKLYEYLDKL